MSKIKSTKQFKEQVDAAFATMQTRDEAKACRARPRARRDPGVEAQGEGGVREVKSPLCGFKWLSRALRAL